MKQSHNYPREHRRVLVTVELECDVAWNAPAWARAVSGARDMTDEDVRDLVERGMAGWRQAFGTLGQGIETVEIRRVTVERVA